MVDNRRLAVLRRTATLAVTFLTLTSALALTSDAAVAATTPPTFGPQFDIGSGFSQPQGVAVNAAGDVYVADQAANAVYRIPADGGPTVSVGSGFRNPMGVAVDSDDNVYVADWGNGRVAEIAANGAQSTRLDRLSAPSGVAIAPDGDLLIANAGGHDVIDLPPGSSTYTEVATGLTLPTGVAVGADGAVYVADSSNSSNNVTRYVSGQPPEVLPIPGLQNPNSIAFDAGGDLFVANSGANNVLMVTPDGTTTHVGGNYIYPGGVAVNGSGDVIVADTYTPRVTVNPSVDPQEITFSHQLPSARAPGTVSGLSATGGGSGNPVTYSVDPSTYPAGTCRVNVPQKRVRYLTVGTCVLDVDQAGSLRYLPAHRTVSITVRPHELASLAVQAPSAPQPAGANFTVSARGLDASGHDLGDVTAITTFTVDNGSCYLDSCYVDTAGKAFVHGITATSARGRAPVAVSLVAALLDGNGVQVTSLAADLSDPIQGYIDAYGGSSGSYTFVKKAGSLPPGVTLANVGFAAQFTGTPTRIGTFTFSYLVSDSADPAQHARVDGSIVVTG